MSIQKLGQALNPAINESQRIFASADNYLASMIVTNKDNNNSSEATILLIPFGVTDPEGYIYIIKDISIDPSNALETHRFAIDPGDQLYVKSNTGTLNFILTGIRQTTYKSSLEQTFYNKTISGEFNTVNNLPNSSLLNSQITLMGEQMDLGETVADLDYFQFDTVSTPTSAVGRMIWDDGSGTSSLGLKGGNIDLPIGQENVVLCYNNNPVELTKGTVVYINGSQGQRPTVAKSSASSESSSSKTLGVVAENIAIGQEGFVTTFGVLKGLNTILFQEGAALWLSATEGQLTTTPPQSPDHLVFVGYCVRSHESSGQIFVEPQNGYEIEELHNVLISSPQDGDYLTYNSSTSLWENTSLTIYPDQTGNENKFLKTDGTNVVWESVPAVLPSQVGNAGKYLTTDGTNAAWETIDFSAYATLDSPTFTGTTTLSETILYTNRDLEIDNTYIPDLVSGKRYFVNTLLGAVGLRLPSTANVGDEIEVFDATNNASNNNITVSSNGLKVEGAVQDFVIDISADNARLVYTGSNYGWVVMV